MEQSPMGAILLRPLNFYINFSRI